jgi:hypothetical protein
MTTQVVCPNCLGKKVIEAICEVSPEWEGIKNEDQELNCTPDNICSGQICTTDNTCLVCNGKGYVNG